MKPTEGPFAKRLALTGNFFLDPLTSPRNEMIMGATAGARTPRSARVRRGSEPDVDDDLAVAPARAVDSGKVLSLSGNYFVHADQSELAHHLATGPVSADLEVSIDRLLAAERGLLPLDIAWFHTVFSRFDRDRSGSISASELSDALRFLGQNPLSFEVDQMISAVDVSSDGSLSFCEFLHLMEAMPATGNVIEECFRVFDEDGTGRISREELAHVLCSQADPLSEAELAELLAYADRNGDGQIDYREFAELLTGSHTRVAQEMAAITDEAMVVAVQLARAQGYTWIKRALGVSGIRATEYLPTPRAASRVQWRRVRRLSQQALHHQEAQQRQGEGATLHQHFQLQIEPNAPADWPIHERGAAPAKPKAELPSRARHYLANASVAAVPGAREHGGTGLLAGAGHAAGRQPIGAVAPPVKSSLAV